MTIWLDNQLPPALAAWMRVTLAVDCVPIRDLNLQRASDAAIFTAARESQVTVMTKDADFAALVDQLGAPPQVILVTCGNYVPAPNMCRDLSTHWKQAAVPFPRPHNVRP